LFWRELNSELDEKDWEGDGGSEDVIRVDGTQMMLEMSSIPSNSSTYGSKESSKSSDLSSSLSIK
jgi:hypothetical protein